MADQFDELRTLRHRLKEMEDLIWRLYREPFAAEIGLLYAEVTTAIAAAPDIDTLGEGEAILRVRGGPEGVDLTNGAGEVRVLSHFTVEIPAATRILIAPDGDAYMLVAADYCPG